MKIYLAAAWSRREEISTIAEKLRNLGVEITSNWLTEETTFDPKSGGREKFLRDRAYIDLNDIDRADALVRFTDVYIDRETHKSQQLVPIHLISGARMFEMGYAKAKGKTLYVVGGKQNVFDRLDGVVHVKDVDELYKIMSQEDYVERSSSAEV
jgi:nucleoside 2-deoxyribosyltransferase